MTERPVLEIGDYGSDVGTVQQCLRLIVDFDFGSTTKMAVQDFQRAHGLTADGVVGEQTWGALDEEYTLPEYPMPLYELDGATVAKIIEIAENSQIARYSWRDRGVSPSGYIKGMAVAFAIALTRYRNQELIAQEMARRAGNPDTDALAYYDKEFAALNMENDHDGVTTLRHLYCFLIGLGMRESSGRHCEGRDMSASNVSSDTAEAGLFQMSWNASACSSSMHGLFDAYDEADDADVGYQEVFEEGVSCSESEWDCYGSGDGENYQMMAKDMPLFAVETAAIGVRSLRAHWGPIGRREVEIRSEADAMLMAVQVAMSKIDPQPPSDAVPEWLLVMRAITGLTETPGSADNPKIMSMPKIIARIFPDMANYCALYTHDSIAWCGLTAAFCFSIVGIRPPFGPNDTDRWMWALSWADLEDATSFEKIDEPRQGCVVVMEREGGGHVTFFEEMDGSNYRCRGGNQSDSVNVQSYSPDTVVALMWPKTGDPVLPSDKPRVRITIEPAGSVDVEVEGSV